VTRIAPLIAAVAAALTLAACNQKKEQEGTEPIQAPVAAPANPAAGSAPGGSAAPGAAPIGSGAPAGTLAAEANHGGTGATTPAPVACATQSAPACGAGQIDGCTGGLTSVHTCVAADAKAGTPCAEGAALTCPTGQIDACTFAPPYASNHICVVVPKPTP
jgi:hypothetical protein